MRIVDELMRLICLITSPPPPLENTDSTSLINTALEGLCTKKSNFHCLGIHDVLYRSHVKIFPYIECLFYFNFYISCQSCRCLQQEKKILKRKNTLYMAKIYMRPICIINIPRYAASTVKIRFFVKSPFNYRVRNTKIHEHFHAKTPK